jgi:hypothetical protein
MVTDHPEDRVCPLGNVHRRMDDAHRLWHQALEAYFNPDRFRVALQSCIQALRTITWLLQNHKGLIPDFEGWYGEWQTRMRADPIMRWLVEARNRIEKRGDLESQSKVRAQIIASYLNELPTLEVEARLFETLDTLFARIPRVVLEKQVLEHGVLKVERRWVATDLPGFELLDALAHVYGMLARLVGDAHQQLGLPTPTTMLMEGDDIRPAAGGGPEDGRLPCMVAVDAQRSVLISLKTGQRLEFERRPRDLAKADLELCEAKYGPVDAIRPDEDINTLRALAQWYFKVARRVFLTDGYHSPMALLIRDNKPIIHLEIRFDDRSQKYLMMRHLAAEVEMCNANAVILINEIWRGESNPQEPFVYPSEMQDRSEHLALSACSLPGETFHFTAEIRREGDKVELGETLEHEVGFAWIFEPIREVWRRGRG